jgi:hypothetical protein
MHVRFRTLVQFTHNFFKRFSWFAIEKIGSFSLSLRLIVFQLDTS